MEHSHALQLGLIIFLQCSIILAASLGSSANDSIISEEASTVDADKVVEGSGGYEETGSGIVEGNGETEGSGKEENGGSEDSKGNGFIKKNGEIERSGNYNHLEGSGNKNSSVHSEGNSDSEVSDDREESDGHEGNCDSEGSGDSKGNDDSEVSGEKEGSRQRATCLHLCIKLYSCNSDEAGLFELDLKGDRCVDVCGTNLICEEKRRWSLKINKYGYGSLKTRLYTCGPNKRLDRNGVCRDIKST